MCNGDVEMEDHCSFKCDYVQGAWRKLWAWWNNSSIRIDSLDSFKSNILSVDNRKSSWAGFKAVSMVMLWLIWKKRNRVLFADVVDVKGFKDEDNFPILQRIALECISNRKPAFKLQWDSWIKAPMRQDF